MVGEISWTKNILILTKCKNPLEREFYLAYCDLPKVQPLVAQIGWTHNLISATQNTNDIRVNKKILDKLDNVEPYSYWWRKNHKGKPIVNFLIIQTYKLRSVIDHSLNFWNMPDPTDKIKSQIGKIQDSINKGQRQT